MGSVERKQRLKEDVRCKILEAGWNIVVEEGWPALSMRKIADAIEYTAPIIYGHFQSKDALLQEFTRKGHVLLSAKVKEARTSHDTLEKQLEAMWLAYWDFAFEQPAYYKLMYGVEMGCCEAGIIDCPFTEMASKQVLDVITALIAASNHPEQDPERRFYTCWAILHGLISLNMVQKNRESCLSEEFNRTILNDAIKGIIKTILQ
ncbi:transcriptional regulator, TetR family [Chitinophaga costaii]|uniref:Transcriptional regulator, TetR family n=1 Tax=Chitinophaga costaii TaxID=1335309 RepID=A0A1C4FM21_9BACT|nr:TetR/AcrR family transcriptional regulator [Chitinophaga costaii]PUZ29944.1 TetR/AcrR family transcriptional regulator [Chitinophaga costaii]SCC57047.1 transcriptional regulator, TetR family [Chitinophaga costaii]